MSATLQNSSARTVHLPPAPVVDGPNAAHLAKRKGLRLNELKSGETARILKVSMADAGCRKRFAELGLAEGMKVTIASTGDAILLIVGGSRMGVAARCAEEIMVARIRWRREVESRMTPEIAPAFFLQVAMTLDELPLGQSAKVLKLSGSSGVRRRLMEMGITASATIEAIRRAPLGDPLDVKIRGYHLSLRREEAAAVVISDPASPAVSPAPPITPASGAV